MTTKIETLDKDSMCMCWGARIWKAYAVASVCLEKRWSTTQERASVPFTDTPLAQGGGIFCAGIVARIRGRDVLRGNKPE